MNREKFIEIINGEIEYIFKENIGQINNDNNKSIMKKKIVEKLKELSTIHPQLELEESAVIPVMAKLLFGEELNEKEIVTLEKVFCIKEIAIKHIMT